MSKGADRTRALDRVLELTSLLGVDAAVGLGALGLTEARAHLVWVLHHGGPTSSADLARAMAVTPRNVTGLVDALVDTGFVVRQPHATDRRAMLVALTAHGRTVCERMVRDHAQLADALFASMSPAEFTGFTAGLDMVLDRLRPLVTSTHGAGS